MQLDVSNQKFKQSVNAEKLTDDELNRFSQAIKYDIDVASKNLFDGGFRSHLGASLIGDDCSRKLWYIFRWVKQSSFSGRMQRLFKRGHRMESVFIRLLKEIGFTVYDLDPDTNEQFRIIGIENHYGGGLDGIGLFPHKYLEWMPKLATLGNILLEFKTHKDTQFKKILKEGVKRSHPKHFAQMSAYGAGYGLNYGLYGPVNKDTDDVDFQLIELNHDLGNSLLHKAHTIIYAQEPPPRIAQQPSYFECKFCDYQDVCHYGTGTLAVNCRSCINAIPIANGQWHCNLYNNIIPDEFIVKGCDSWKSIT